MDDWLAVIRREYEHFEPFVDAIFGAVLLAFLAYLWTMKGLLLGRATPLGLWLARSKITQAFAVVVAFLGYFFSFFMADFWRYATRILVAYCCWHVWLHLKAAFGGFKAMHARAARSAKAWLRREPEPDHEELLR